MREIHIIQSELKCYKPVVLHIYLNSKIIITTKIGPVSEGPSLKLHNSLQFAFQVSFLCIETCASHKGQLTCLDWPAMLILKAVVLCILLNRYSRFALAMGHVCSTE